MSDLIRDFEADCEAAGVAPAQVLKRAGLNPSTWFRWKSNTVSPTLRSFEAARAALAAIEAGDTGANTEGQAGLPVSLGKIGALP